MVSVVRSTTTGIPTGRPACSAATSAVRYNGERLGTCTVQGSAVARTLVRNPRRLQLQPRLQRLAARSGHPLDPRQEPDVLGGSHVRSIIDQKFTGSKALSGTQLGATKPTAVYEYKDQRCRQLERPRSAQLLILNLDGDQHQEGPRQETAGGFLFRRSTAVFGGNSRNGSSVPAHHASGWRLSARIMPTGRCSR